MILSQFEYIKLPKLTDNYTESISELLLLNNGQRTLDHVQAVSQTAVSIAEQYGLDKSVCALSGYLHDISAVIKPDDMLLYAEQSGMRIYEAEKRYPFLLHQRISRLIAEQFFNITDERILSAVECHSTLKTAPSPYDTALFVADKLSWDKDGLPPYHKPLTEALHHSLEAASLSYIDYIYDYNMILFPHDWCEGSRAYLRNIINKEVT